MRFFLKDIKFKAVIFIVCLFFSMNIFAQNKVVLMVMSAADTLLLDNGQKKRQTGVFLSEFYLPYKMLTENGYQVVFATPNGVKATIDLESVNEKYWKNSLLVRAEALEFVVSNNDFDLPITLKSAVERLNSFCGIVIPGGQGLMVDLSNNPLIPIILSHFGNADKPTGLVCHAPSLILTIPKAENPFVGYSVNSVSPFEEFVIERFIMKGIPKNRKIAKQLKKLGMKYKSKYPKANYAVRDRHLVSSQNPYSCESFNILYKEALESYFNQKYILK